ncbi:MAG: PDDEXK nuclease domain-containing protein [Campylobacterota bacterium]|nr:PDDEXK nuclease domain-containing protein [Campylobacterota bacterium]
MNKDLATSSKDEFSNILKQIQSSKQKAYTSVNTILVELYWNIGNHISDKVKQKQWGKGVVKELADFIKLQDPTIKGFTLEALDRDVKTKEENPSIGILLCREKNDEVVKYALNRSISPLVIADYETKLIPKKLLQDKLNEIYELLESKDKIYHED